MKRGFFHARGGSALLVVLGMLSFMLFSGLAFSVYMRQTRLPTSFLRRTASSRQLVKAALAEAIDQIDLAIGNDPHPGIRAVDKKYYEDQIDNFWNHRIFCGLGSTSNPESGDFAKTGNYYPQLVEQDETVPTLTLEGLAYLPPNLINEARYYSQRTPTAKWHSFWFDSGRYAYTAIDVSDYFDVNRAFANKPRAACASRRVSFAHLFESGSDHSGAGTGASQWDETFMKAMAGRTVNDSTDVITFNEYPFLSIADFNIALNVGGVASHVCPFNAFLDGERAYDCGEGEDDATAEYYRNLNFVTDGWFPTPSDENNKTPNTNKTKKDLAGVQPFRDTDLNGSSMPSMVNKIMAYSSDLVNSSGNGADLMNHLCGLGLVQLWDYLDVNRVPVSLAAPTLERVPMIVGIEPTLPTKIKIQCAAGPNPTLNTSGTPSTSASQSFTYTLLLDGTFGANVLVAYPFLEHGIDDSEEFTVEGRMALFFTVNGKDISLRPGNNNPGLHLTKTVLNNDNNSVLPNSVLSFTLTKQQVKGSNIAQDPSKPVKKIGLRGSSGLAAQEFFKVKYTWNPKGTQGDDGTITYQYNNADQASGNVADSTLHPDAGADTVATIQALTSNGSIAPEFAANFATLIQDGIDIKVNAAIWVRVTYHDPDMGEKTVDLVPACVADDDELNSANNTDSRARIIGGEAYPLMRYVVKANDQDTIKVQAKTSNTTDDYALTIERPKIICNDPRYNHQPENWYSLSGTELSENDWITETQKMLGKNGCDSDFFLFTSDAGYMQSVYELAFLPRFTDLTQSGKKNGWWGFYSTTIPDRNTFVESYSAVKDYDVMWRTYRCFDSNGVAADPFEEIGIVCGDNGIKVNPYSESTRVLMAAFANTPHDWRVASTNRNYAIVSDSERNNAATFNRKHAWNDYSSDSDGKMCWDCIRAIAEEFKAKVRKTEIQNAAKNDNYAIWEEAFADLAWSSNTKKIIDFTETDFSEDADSPMYGVDKKFLYGFWHDSFAARQQLFLIFVRAEPMMMGGGVSGQIPPQLGGRAVALVWRDPSETKVEREIDGISEKRPNPHRTRILFYHPFE